MLNCLIIWFGDYGPNPRVCPGTSASLDVYKTQGQQRWDRKPWLMLMRILNEEKLGGKVYNKFRKYAMWSKRNVESFVYLSCMWQIMYYTCTLTSVLL